ncbi:MAG: GNAT family N-acetyltransferase [Candidatus Aadella gelida]|nr:GNAT family N-acetyltransferase [Candidatus Aadella gelida]
MTKKYPLTSPTPLDGSHIVDSFDCDNAALNDYLQKFALTNNQSGSARTFVACRNNEVAGYYSLAAGSVVQREKVPPRITKGLARHPIPVVLLARLAVDRSEWGSGIGKGLLLDSLLRIVKASDTIGVRAVLVEAKDEKAKAFYEHFGFEPSPVDKYHLYLLIKDIKKTLEI